MGLLRRRKSAPPPNDTQCHSGMKSAMALWNYSQRQAGIVFARKLRRSETAPYENETDTLTTKASVRLTHRGRSSWGSGADIQKGSWKAAIDSGFVERLLKIRDHDLLHLEHGIHGSQGLLLVGRAQKLSQLPGD